MLSAFAENFKKLNGTFKDTFPKKKPYTEDTCFQGTGKNETCSLTSETEKMPERKLFKKRAKPDENLKYVAKGSWLPEEEMFVTNFRDQHSDNFGFIMNSPAMKAFKVSNVSMLQTYESSIRKKNSKSRVLFSFGWPFSSKSSSLLKKKKMSCRSAQSATCVLEQTPNQSANTLLNSKYSKFIPVTKPERDILPMSAFDKRYPLPWFDAQAWYQGYKEQGRLTELTVFLNGGEILAPKVEHSLRLPGISKSDSQVPDDDIVQELRSTMRMLQKRRRKLKKSKLSKLPFNSTFFKAGCAPGLDILEHFGGAGDNCISKICKHSKKSSPSITYEDMELRTAKRHPPNRIRFGKVNEKFCFAIADILNKRLINKPSHRDPNYPSVEIYIQQPKTSLKLCKLKAEMAHSCLKSFFFPCLDEVNIVWIRDIDSSIIANLPKDDTGNMKDVFGRTVRPMLDDLLAVVFLSTCAVTLMRHQNLCLLETLSVSLGIDQFSLLLLEDMHKPKCIVG